VAGTFEYNCGEQEKGALKAAETRQRKKQEKEAESAQNREEMVLLWGMPPAIRGIY